MNPAVCIHGRTLYMAVVSVADARASLSKYTAFTTASTCAEQIVRGFGA